MLINFAILYWHHSKFSNPDSVRVKNFSSISAASSHGRSSAQKDRYIQNQMMLRNLKNKIKGEKFLSRNDSSGYFSGQDSPSSLKTEPEKGIYKK